jgi:hypothetical protein
MRWGRILGNFAAAFFISLASTTAAGIPSGEAFHIMLYTALIYGGVAASQEFKRENDKEPKLTKNRSKRLNLTFLLL